MEPRGEEIVATEGWVGAFVDGELYPIVKRVGKLEATVEELECNSASDDDVQSQFSEIEREIEILKRQIALLVDAIEDLQYRFNEYGERHDRRWQTVTWLPLEAK